MKEDEIYRQLSEDTEDICQIIIKNGFKDQLLSNQNYNVILICYHLLAIIYIKIKNSKSLDEAEGFAKKIIYETVRRLPKEYEGTLIENSSRIITKYMAIYRQSNKEIKESNLDFSTELSKGICEIFSDDPLYFMKEEYNVVISELANYINSKLKLYEELI